MWRLVVGAMAGASYGAFGHPALSWIPYVGSWLAVLAARWDDPTSPPFSGLWWALVVLGAGAGMVFGALWDYWYLTKDQDVEP